jgi:hypothetical protein
VLIDSAQEACLSTDWARVDPGSFHGGYYGTFHPACVEEMTTRSEPERGAEGPDEGTRAQLLRALGDRRPGLLLSSLTDTREVSLDATEELWRSARLGERAVNLYVHVPFCARRCLYCMYPSRVLGGAQEIERYLVGLEEQIARYAPYLKGRRLQTQYVGGGTVTVLSEGALSRLLGLVNEAFAFPRLSERTAELNPASCSLEKLGIMAEGGITRVSAGVQTLSPELLHGYGRESLEPAALLDLLSVAAELFISCNIDLMLGLQGQREADFMDDLERVVGVGASEIHCYVYQDVGRGVNQALLSRYADVAERVRRRFGDRYQVAVNAYKIHLSRETLLTGLPMYSLHDEREAATLGLGTFAGTRLPGLGEYQLADHGASLTRYAPGYEAIKALVDGITIDGEIELDAYRRRFKIDLEARHAAFIAEASAAGWLRIEERRRDELPTDAPWERFLRATSSDELSDVRLLVDQLLAFEHGTSLFDAYVSARRQLTKVSGTAGDVKVSRWLRVHAPGAARALVVGFLSPDQRRRALASLRASSPEGAAASEDAEPVWRSVGERAGVTAFLSCLDGEGGARATGELEVERVAVDARRIQLAGALRGGGEARVIVERFSPEGAYYRHTDEVGLAYDCAQSGPPFYAQLDRLFDRIGSLDMASFIELLSGDG